MSLKRKYKNKDNAIYDIKNIVIIFIIFLTAIYKIGMLLKMIFYYFFVNDLEIRFRGYDKKEI